MKEIKTKTPIKVIKPTKLDRAIMEYSYIEVKNKSSLMIAKNKITHLKDIKHLLSKSPNNRSYKYTFFFIDKGINEITTKITLYRNRA